MFVFLLLVHNLLPPCRFLLIIEIKGSLHYRGIEQMKSDGPAVSGSLWKGLCWGSLQKASREMGVPQVALGTPAPSPPPWVCDQSGSEHPWTLSQNLWAGPRESSIVFLIR